jgi:hypothetical protein
MRRLREAPILLTRRDWNRLQAEPGWHGWHGGTEGHPMAQSPAPIVTVDPDGAGKAPILSYNVPDGTSYSGRNVLRLAFDSDASPFVAAEPVPVSEVSVLPGPALAMMRREPNGDTPEPPFGEGAVSATVRLTGPQAGTTITATGTTVPVTALVTVDVTPHFVKPINVAVRFGTEVVPATLARPGVWQATRATPAGSLALVGQAEVDGTVYESPPRVVDVVLTPVPTPPPDTTPPVISGLIPPDGTAVQFDPGTSGAAVTVSGTVTEASGGATVSIRVDGGQATTPIVGANGAFSAQLSLTLPGRRRIEVTATDLSGNSSTSSFVINVLQDSVTPHYELVIAEYLQLSNFLGAYGAGRTVQTFSLLPGERTTITIKTFSSTTTTNSSTSSFLDSFSGSSSTALEDAVESEQTTKSSEDKAFKASASVEASASWGVASAKVSGSLAYGTNSARESLGKSVMSAVSKHASEVSAKRDVKVDTAGTTEGVQSDERTVERVLENINVSRTLNFVFRQMNQEFVSILHLVDVRIGLVTRYRDEAGEWLRDSRGIVSTYREVTLPQLDALLGEVVKPDQASYVRSAVLAQLDTVVDWKGNRRDVVEWATLTRPARNASGVVIPGSTVTDGPYLRFRPSRPATPGGPPPEPTGTDTYTDGTGNHFDVPGVILQATKVTLRTDGIMVDAILGGGNALDPYSTALQETAIAAKQAANGGAAEELNRRALARTLVEELDGDEAIDAYARLFVAPEMISSNGVGPS